jgi:hypothetical protein
MNYWMGPTARKNYSILTGKEDITEAGTIYQLDG